jgi:hypothetical protein
MEEHLELFIWSLALMPAYYVGFPLFMRWHGRYPAHPKTKELNFEKLGLSIAEFLMTQTKALFELGFDEPTMVQIPNAASYVNSFRILLVNRQTGDTAMVTAIVAQAPMIAGQPLFRLQALSVEFSTCFDSGEVFDTHNIPVILAFPPAPMTVRTQVPMVKDSHELFRLHTFVMTKHNPQGKKVLYEPGQGLDYLSRVAFLKPYDEQVKRGWLYYDQKNDLYRLTFKGAYLIGWRLMQPVKALLRIALNRKAKNTLEEFHQSWGLPKEVT